MDITERFIEGVLDLLPKEGLDKLNRLIDEDDLTKESLDALLKEYNVDPVKALEKGDKEEEQR